MAKKITNLAPHERKIVENEFLKEELIQKRLAKAIFGSINERIEKATQAVANILREKGYTAQDILNSDSNDELKKEIWKAVDDNWHLFSKIPPRYLRKLLGISGEEFNAKLAEIKEENSLK